MARQDWYLYVLKLQQGKYYVGITPDFPRRFQQHSTGSGAAWTKRYPPVEVVELISLGSAAFLHAENLETSKTLQLIKDYGWKNVRGGKFFLVCEHRHLAHLANCYAKFRHEPEVTAWLAVNEHGKFFVPYIWAVFAGGRARITSSWNSVLELKEGWRYSAHQRFPRSQLPHAYRWLRLMSARYNPAELRPIARRAILAGKRNEKMEALCGEEWGLIAKIFARQR